MSTDSTKRNVYPDKELTEKIIGCSFKVFNNLGYGLAERIYQTAMAVELSKNKIQYKKELFGKVIFKEVVVGRYFLDFLVEKKIAVELKVRNEIYDKDVSQLLNYLKSKKLKIGLLLAITKNGIKIKRLIN